MSTILQLSYSANVVVQWVFVGLILLCALVGLIRKIKRTIDRSRGIDDGSSPCGCCSDSCHCHKRGCDNDKCC
jgi:hypothetical protein